MDASPEKPIPVICVIENKIVRKPLMDAVRLTHEVAKAIEAKEFDRAMELRGPEFAEYYNAYMTTTATDQPELRLPENKVRSELPLVDEYCLGHALILLSICGLL